MHEIAILPPCYEPPLIACYCEAEPTPATNPTLQGSSTAKAPSLCNLRGVRSRSISRDIIPPTSGTSHAMRNHRFGCIVVFQVQQSSNTHSLATDMSVSDVCIVGDAGGGCCYPYLHDFHRFWVDVYACDAIIKWYPSRTITHKHKPHLKIKSA
jgi:hypothetical protein